MSKTAERINLMFPIKIAKKLKKFPPGQRSRLVVQALEKELKRLDLLQFIEKMEKSKQPVWNEKDHSDLITENQIKKYGVPFRLNQSHG
ncbi:MAG: hypothetical protein ACYDBV_00160 [Nitrospiria bacterium]